MLVPRAPTVKLGSAAQGLMFLAGWPSSSGLSANKACLHGGAVVRSVDHTVENRAERTLVDVTADLNGDELRARRDAGDANRVAAHGRAGVRPVEEQVGVDLGPGEILLNGVRLGEGHNHGVFVDDRRRVERPQQVYRARRIHSALR